MPKSTSHKEIKRSLESISNKRARIVIEHILEHGFITTEQLEKQYGYNHPPRAARDVREAGIPLETFRVKDSEGRSIAAYRFGDVNNIQKGRLEGRQTFPKQFRDEFYAPSGGKCSICNGSFEQRYLQVDHRVPYEVAGNSQDELNSQEFMLVCGSCNRAKSWSCEHCANWQDKNLRKYVSGAIGQTPKIMFILPSEKCGALIFCGMKMKLSCTKNLKHQQFKTSFQFLNTSKRL